MFAIPTLKDLVERARQSFRSNLPGSDAWAWPNNLNPTAKVLGGLTHEVFGFADYIQRQKFALTADGENLDLHGEELGLSRRPAAPARGPITITAPGAIVVEVGALFARTDGVQFRALAGGALPGAGAVTLDVVATTDGANTTTIPETPLAILSGISGAGAATATAAVSVDGIAAGTDVEQDGAFFTGDLGTFRGRILFRKRNPPHGGSAADYVSWAAEVSGVTRVFVERLWSGAGTVRVFVLMDDLYRDGIPTSADTDRVVDHIESLRPAGAKVAITAPIAVPVNIIINGLSPDTTAIRNAVILELSDTFRRLSRVAGIDSEIGGMPYLASPTSFSRSWIWQAIANASGEERHILAAPLADVSLTPGQIATLGTVTFA